MHIETAPLARVRQKERLRMKGKRLFVLLAMH